MSVTTVSLLAVLAEATQFSVVEEAGCLVVTNDEGLDAFVTLGEQQILVESVLFPAANIADVAALNDQILRTQQLTPLTSVGLKKIDGEDYYIAFGALSTDSKDSVIIEEIDTLFANIDDFIELYSDNMKEVA
jgi:hypothetical protein